MSATSVLDGMASFLALRGLDCDSPTGAPSGALPTVLFLITETPNLIGYIKTCGQNAGLLVPQPGHPPELFLL